MIADYGDVFTCLASVSIGGLTETEIGPIYPNAATWFESLTSDEKAALRSYAGPNFHRARKIEVEAMSLAPYDIEVEWKPLDLIKHLQAAHDAVPSEYKDAVYIDWEDSYDYTVPLKFKYGRWETPEEVGAHIASLQNYLDGEANRARATYENLKRRFGG
jgi:hypothetical protein